MKIRSYLYLLLVILMIAFGQTLAKLGADLLNRQVFWGILPAGYILIAIAYLIMLLRAVIWLQVVRVVPLSVAYPILSLSFIVILLLSAVFFAETVTARKVLASLFIISGTILVGQKNNED